MNDNKPEIINESAGSNSAELEIRAPATLVYFQGHFPDQPVLPGVVQLHWAIHLARERFELKPSFRGMEVLKFHRIIEPDTPVTLVIESLDEGSKLKFSYTSELGMHSQGRVLFE